MTAVTTDGEHVLVRVDVLGSRLRDEFCPRGGQAVQWFILIQGPKEQLAHREVLGLRASFQAPRMPLGTRTVSISSMCATVPYRDDLGQFPATLSVADRVLRDEHQLDPLRHA